MIEKETNVAMVAPALWRISGHHWAWVRWTDVVETIASVYGLNPFAICKDSLDWWHVCSTGDGGIAVAVGNKIREVRKLIDLEQYAPARKNLLTWTYSESGTHAHVWLSSRLRVQTPAPDREAWEPLLAVFRETLIPAGLWNNIRAKYAEMQEDK